MSQPESLPPGPSEVAWATERIDYACREFLPFFLSPMFVEGLLDTYPDPLDRADRLLRALAAMLWDPNTPEDKHMPLTRLAHFTLDHAEVIDEYRGHEPDDPHPPLKVGLEDGMILAELTDRGRNVYRTDLRRIIAALQGHIAVAVTAENEGTQDGV